MCQVFIKMSWIRSSLVLFALLTKHCYQQLKNKMRTLELPWKISFGSQKNIHYRDELYALWTFYWLSMFFQWPSKTHCIKSSYTMSDNEETALSLKNFTIQTIPTISPDRILNLVELVCSVFPSTSWTSGFPYQHPHGPPLKLATAALYSSRQLQAHLSWQYPISRYMLSAYGLLHSRVVHVYGGISGPRGYPQTKRDRNWWVNAPLSSHPSEEQFYNAFCTFPDSSKGIKPVAQSNSLSDIPLGWFSSFLV